MRSRVLGVFVPLLLAFARTSVSSSQQEDSNKTYDYIVVGSGPGGGPLASNLARAGYSTLLIEAGDDESSDPATNVAAYFVTTGIPDNLHWDFYVRHYSDLNRTLAYEHLVWRLTDGNLWVGPGSTAPKGAVMLGVEYPRGATLGGSSIINAGAVYLPPDNTWDNIGAVTGDSSWSAAEARRLFVKLENNLYLPNGTAGHGFNGYLDVNIGDGTQYLSSNQSIDVLNSMIRELGEDPKDIKELLTRDSNYLSATRDKDQGLWALPFHVNKTFGRYSSRNRILDTIREVDKNGAQKHPLHLQLNSLVSKVLFSKSSNATPVATGVEFLEGKSIYKGDPRYKQGNNGTLRKVYAKKEVIISGGSFSTPQILKLSGIGPAAELANFSIPVVSNLPGVGSNMQDNEEIGIFGLAAENFTSAAPDSPQCTPGVAGDPCYELWLQGKGPYTNAGPNSNIALLTTNHSTDGNHDMTMFSGNFVFKGFWPATPNQSWVEPPNTWGIHTIKMNPQNRAGYVRLKSADPTDTPDINFNFYSQGPDVDLGAMKETIAWARRAYMNVSKPTAPINITSPPCPAGIKRDGTCSDPNSDEEWIKNQSFGHHVTSTCAIGGDADPNAVLDSKFRVRGVQNLRVVDASVFPKIPGSFPVVSVYIISEKASEAILQG